MQSIFRNGLFQGKTALVTGGGRGIGLRIAQELADLGAEVFIASRKEDRLKEALNEFKDGQKVDYVPINIRDEESVEKGVDNILSKAGKIDFLVNNAGGQFVSPAESISTKGWNAVIDTNLNGTYNMSKALYLKSMKENGGSIINITANIERGFPLMSHTGAARAAVQNLTKSLAVEWGGNGVRVNAVAPGIIDSVGIRTNYPKEFLDQVQNAAATNQTTRLGTESEVSGTVLFLLSPAASFITGEVVCVDGGERLFTLMFPPRKNDKHPQFNPTYEDKL